MQGRIERGNGIDLSRQSLALGLFGRLPEQDRLGRSLRHLIELMGELEQKEIGFRILQEAIDSTSPGGKLSFHMFGALAEFARNLIQERAQAGLAAARARGRHGGRPKALDPRKQQVAVGHRVSSVSSP